MVDKIRVHLSLLSLPEQYEYCNSSVLTADIGSGSDVRRMWSTGCSEWKVYIEKEFCFNASR